MKKEFIVLIPVEFKESLVVANKFKGKSFNSLAELSDAITDALIEDAIKEDEEILIFSVEGFVTACNDQQFDSLTEYFLTSVFVD